MWFLFHCFLGVAQDVHFRFVHLESLSGYVLTSPATVFLQQCSLVFNPAGYCICCQMILRVYRRLGLCWKPVLVINKFLTVHQCIRRSAFMFPTFSGCLFFWKLQTWHWYHPRLLRFLRLVLFLVLFLMHYLFILSLTCWFLYLLFLCTQNEGTDIQLDVFSYVWYLSLKPNPFCFVWGINSLFQEFIVYLNF